MSTASRVTIRESFDLPSRGKFPGVPAKITLRAMSLLDERQRLASNSINGIIDLIGNCIVDPDNVNPYDMPRFDIDYAMMKLRVISHGSNYNAEVVCPYCGSVNKEVIDLDKIPCNYVDDDFEPEFEVGPLPVSGDILKIKILTFNDVNKIEAEAKRVLQKFPNYEGDPTDVLNYIYKIQQVNGEKIPYTQLKSYIESMPASDSIYLDQVYDEALGRYGLDTRIQFTCDKCKETFMRSMPMNDEFFRPKFNIEKRSNVQTVPVSTNTK